MEALPRKLYCCVVVVDDAAIAVVIESKQALLMEASANRLNEMHAKRTWLAVGLLVLRSEMLLRLEQLVLLWH